VSPSPSSSEKRGRGRERGRGRLLPLAALLLGCAPRTPAPTTTVTLAPPGTPAQLPPAGTAAPATSSEGLRVLVAPRPGTPFLTLALRWDTGSADDPPGKEGLAQLTARLWAGGGTRRLSPAQLERALYPLAARFEVTVGEETTTLLVRAAAKDLPRLLPIVRELLAQPRDDAAELERQRAQALSFVERELRGERDEDLGKAALDALVFAGHPYAHPPAGTARGLRAIKLDDVRGFRTRLFGQRRLTLALAGATTDAVATELRAIASALPPGEARDTETPEVPAGGPRAVIVQKETASVAISMGFPLAVTRADADWLALRVAMAAFGEHRQSGGRLYQRLRAARGLNYGDYAYVERFHEDGGRTIQQPGHPRRRPLFSIWLRPVEPPNAVFATRAAVFELARLVREGLSEEELERTKRFLAGYSLLWDETDRLRLGWALDDAFYGAPHALARLRRDLGTLTLAQVNAALRKHLDPARLRFAFVARDARALERALGSGAPSPIRYASPRPPKLLEEDKRVEVQPLRLGASDVRVLDGRKMFE